jgi:hypothetical protein
MVRNASSSISVFDRRRRGFLYVVAELLAKSGSVLHSSDAIVVQRRTGGGPRREGDAQASRRHPDLFDVRTLLRRGVVRVADLGAGGGVEERGAVSH